MYTTTSGAKLTISCFPPQYLKILLTAAQSPKYECWETLFGTSITFFKFKHSHKDHWKIPRNCLARHKIWKT